MKAVEHLGQWALALREEQEHERLWIEQLISQSSPQQRRQEGITWYPVKVADEGYGLGAYPFLVLENPRPQKGHSFQSGNPVSLFSEADASKGERVVGVIGFVDDQRMKIVFHCDELPDWIDNGRLGVDALFDEKSYKEMFLALNRTINAEKGRLAELRDCIYGQRGLKWEEEKVEKISHLNESQQRAVEAIVQAQDVAVVHGPPGTGKTTTLVAAIQVMARQGKKILVTAASNAATDHLLQQCIQVGVSGVRIGNTAKVEEDNQTFTMDACLLREKEYKQIKELKKRAVEMRKMGGKYKRSFGKEEADQRRLLFQEAKKLQKEARDWEQYLIDKIIDESAVVAATLIGSNHYYIQDKTWDVVVIDEAGQALGPAAWVAIGHAEKIVLAGDPHQLPPTVKSPKAAELGLSKTLLDVAIGQIPDAVYFLNVQYRMHKDIMAFSNSYFYNDGLMAHDSVADRGWSASESAVVFIDTAGCGFEEQPGADGNSLQNQEEWSLIQKHIEIKQMLAIGDVAVISPYRAQVSWMQNELAEQPRMTVNTIDSFQGQEEDIVYISLVRSNDNSEIGFLKDYRRMNVAMTRAKLGLVIVGDSATLAKDAFYSSMIEMIEKKGGYISAWEILYS